MIVAMMLPPLVPLTAVYLRSIRATKRGSGRDVSNELASYFVDTPGTVPETLDLQLLSEPGNAPQLN
jgi:hypothetical protein